MCTSEPSLAHWTASNMTDAGEDPGVCRELVGERIYCSYEDYFIIAFRTVKSNTFSAKKKKNAPEYILSVTLNNNKISLPAMTKGWRLRH